MNSNYVRGRRFEYKIKKKLEENGFYVIRASGSHGRWDLIGVKEDERSREIRKILLIQCKINKSMGKSKVLREERRSERSEGREGNKESKDVLIVELWLVKGDEEVLEKYL